MKTFFELNQLFLTIIMWKTVENMSFPFFCFTCNPEYWSPPKNPPLKMICCSQMSIFGHFQKSHLWVFSRKYRRASKFRPSKFEEKNLRMCLTSPIYLRVWIITFWDIAIRDRIVFFPHSKGGPYGFYEYFRKRKQKHKGNPLLFYENIILLHCLFSKNTKVLPYSFKQNYKGTPLHFLQKRKVLPFIAKT